MSVFLANPATACVRVAFSPIHYRLNSPCFSFPSFLFPLTPTSPGALVLINMANIRWRRSAPSLPDTSPFKRGSNLPFTHSRSVFADLWINKTSEVFCVCLRGNLGPTGRQIPSASAIFCAAFGGKILSFSSFSDLLFIFPLILSPSILFILSLSLLYEWISSLFLLIIPFLSLRSSLFKTRPTQICLAPP